MNRCFILFLFFPLPSLYRQYVRPPCLHTAVLSPLQVRVPWTYKRSFSSMCPVLFIVLLQICTTIQPVHLLLGVNRRIYFFFSTFYRYRKKLIDTRRREKTGTQEGKFLCHKRNNNKGYRFARRLRHRS
ncbi:hypothetical protein, unlikely [Trypanosoma brucei gambiense DAL972]|uniref:T. brucei spp.-specific protein n=1 Tax=Trypanosoma brucei gambiense (strain MHOM/CI/86/DAL972) TaxID=679716 RepID=D0A8B1_TRYB9|nr:hypothetical protein, unlikely [Trypanosoma brucei gambiense DAL972]CBH17912.1 hypothetical protein, unlikely [Trypanosoma brucei gambiense DAL972]|eukprot:XP_011780176.1 hypothetical protein, unlikely [Trypanosoma brucei gambiense DAL972]